MSEDFLPHQNRFRMQVRSFVQQRLAPQSGLWEARGRFPLATLRQCAQHDLISRDSERNAVVAEELPKCECLGFALTVFVQANLIGPTLNQLGTAQQKKKYLPALFAGKHLGAMAVSEPSSGSDFAALTTRAERTRRGWRLNGVKTYITNAAIADFFIVAAQTDRGEGVQGLSLFLAPAKTKGISVKPLANLGLTTAGAGKIAFDNCEIPAEGLLGDRRQAFGYIQSALNSERLFGGLACVSWAQHALAKTLRYVRERVAFGSTLNRFQSLRHQIADMQTRLEAARRLNYSVYQRWRLQEEVTREICMIKLFSYQVAQDVIGGCLQMHGGLGYTSDHWCSRFYRDARALTIAAGTPEIMKELIAAYMRV
jgi:acyl-CoA dehydrogenase